MSEAQDYRINSRNLYVELTFREYLSFAKDIIKNNSLQRKRVRNSKSVYSLLKEDLKKGCIMPPLVLAITSSTKLDVNKINDTTLLNYIQENPKDIIILDGLQRTYTLIDAAEEMEKSEYYNHFMDDYHLRLEIYLDINKFGILYRMLTLNTGQTPMTTRHQLEILYQDRLNVNDKYFKLMPETKGKIETSKNELYFKNALEGFNSFLNRSELPINREDLLENIKMLEHMSNENLSNDIFEEFLACYYCVVQSLRSSTDDKSLNNDDVKELGFQDIPFANSVHKMFASSQAITGFGSALGKMKDFNIISSFDDIIEATSKLKSSTDFNWFIKANTYLEVIKNTSKKIGNGQRMFFQYFFRELFNKESDSYLSLSDAVENGYQKYNSQVN